LLKSNEKKKALTLVCFPIIYWYRIFLRYCKV